MYISALGLIASAWLAAAPAANASSWQSDYRAAKAQAARETKPMAVVFGKGADGWKQIVTDGAAPASTATLNSTYVCVYVDLATEAGRELAKQFSVTDGPALVLSDRGAKYQAYETRGTMTDATLNQVLGAYSAVQTTSMKQEGAAPAATVAPAAPIYYQPAISGGSCPNCRPRY